MKTLKSQNYKSTNTGSMTSYIARKNKASIGINRLGRIRKARKISTSSNSIAIFYSFYSFFCRVVGSCVKSAMSKIGLLYIKRDKSRARSLYDNCIARSAAILFFDFCSRCLKI